MGLAEITDITETSQVDDTGQLVSAFEVSFLTEETSGRKTVTVLADEFTPELARERAETRAEELDQAVSGEV